MSVPMAATVPTKYISEYTKGLDIPHFLVDGNDVTAVYAAAHEAVEWARAGKGPSMIEAMTYRWYDHAGFAGGRVNQEGALGLPYRTDDEVKQWMTRDPLTRFRKWVVAKNIASDAELAAIDEKNLKAVDASIAFARESAHPKPEDGLLNTYAKEAAVATQFYNRKGLASQPRLT
jgi:pyruvate dehydrogenase E1 component alpha subunit